MSCALCGEGDGWLKNCIKREDRTPGWEWWSRSFRCCDACYAAHAAELLVVPGQHSVSARCDVCKRFVNPREIVPATRRPAAWREAFGGVCTMCAETTR